jgi:hypothetical protein
MQNPDLFRGRGFTPPTGADKIPYGDKGWVYRIASLYIRQSPISSAYLVGETTRRYRLNLDRGSGTLGAQHIVRKREPQQGNLLKVAHNRMAPKVIPSVIGIRRNPSLPHRIHQRS